MADQDYFDEIKRYQKQLDEQLRTPDGWLTLVGLYWLQEGDNEIGSDQSCAIPLPVGTCPAISRHPQQKRAQGYLHTRTRGGGFRRETKRWLRGSSSNRT